jgi:hypothetical protein
MHEDAYYLAIVKPEVAMYDEQSFSPPYPAGNLVHSALPANEPVVCLGKGAGVVRTTDVPRYPELAQYLFDRLNWNGAQFHVYRYRIEYPIVPTAVVLRHGLPEASET